MSPETRLIAHLDLDCFFVTAERLRNPGLRDRPVAVGGTGGRAVVSSASYEARRWGVKAGMPVAMARRLCPELVLVRGDFDYYSRLSAVVTDIVASRSPVWEKASVDEFYMDFTGLDRYLGAWRWLSETAALIERETGLQVSTALATSKTVGKVATGQSKPHGRLQVPPGTEKLFLAPLPVRVLPGAGAQLGERLALMGVRRIRLLQAMPAHVLEQVFGQAGLELWLRAQGIDHRPVVPVRRAQSFSEEHTLEADTDDPLVLESLLARMAGHLGLRLRSAGFRAGTLSLKLRYADFDTCTRQQQLPPTDCHGVLLRVARSLLARAWTRRQRVRLVGLRVSDLAVAQPDLPLFEAEERRRRLYQAMDRLNRRFGPDTVRQAIAGPAALF
jgi:DNA polymerase-4